MSTRVAYLKTSCPIGLAGLDHAAMVGVNYRSLAVAKPEIFDRGCVNLQHSFLPISVQLPYQVGRAIKNVMTYHTA